MWPRGSKATTLTIERILRRVVAGHVLLAECHQQLARRRKLANGVIDRIGGPEAAVRPEVHAMRIAAEEILVAPLPNRLSWRREEPEVRRDAHHHDTVPLPSAPSHVVVPPHSLGSLAAKSPLPCNARTGSRAWTMAAYRPPRARLPAPAREAEWRRKRARWRGHKGVSLRLLISSRLFYVRVPNP